MCVCVGVGVWKVVDLVVKVLKCCGILSHFESVNGVKLFNIYAGIL